MIESLPGRGINKIFLAIIIIPSSYTTMVVVVLVCYRCKMYHVYFNRYDRPQSVARAVQNRGVVLYCGLIARL